MTEPNKSPYSDEQVKQWLTQARQFVIEEGDNMAKKFSELLTEKDRRIAELEETIRQGQKRLDWMVTPDKKLSYAECEIKELQAKVDLLLSNIKYKDEMMGKMAGALESISVKGDLSLPDCRFHAKEALAAYKAMKGK